MNWSFAGAHARQSREPVNSCCSERTHSEQIPAVALHIGVCEKRKKTISEEAAAEIYRMDSHIAVVVAEAAVAAVAEGVVAAAGVERVVVATVGCMAAHKESMSVS